MSSNQINLFNNDSLNIPIITLTDDNNALWFRAKDIALLLGNKNTIEKFFKHVRISILESLKKIKYPVYR